MESYRSLTNLRNSLKDGIRELRKNNSDGSDFWEKELFSRYQAEVGPFLENISNDLKSVFSDFSIISIQDELILFDIEEHGASYVNLDIQFGSLSIQIKGLLFQVRLIVIIDSVAMKKIGKRSNRFNEWRFPDKFFCELMNLSLK